MGVERPKAETSRPELIPHRWTRIDEPDSVVVVAEQTLRDSNSDRCLADAARTDHGDQSMLQQLFCQRVDRGLTSDRARSQSGEIVSRACLARSFGCPWLVNTRLLDRRDESIAAPVGSCNELM